MENQHRKITGYRDLEQHEIDLINEVKAQGERLAELVTKVQAHVHGQRRLAEGTEAMNRITIAEPARWAAIGKTDLQSGLMALTRAVAQPTSF